MGDFFDGLDGWVLRPGESDYDDARAAWNGMVDHRPRMIVKCASVSDVVAAVRYARDARLGIGVRCGGHAALGPAVPDDALLIDLRPLHGVQVDPERRTAVVKGGTMLGAVDRGSLPHGLATTTGSVSHTGVGGFTLGGGMGWLARQYGLACDNVLSFEVVTADGEVVRASRNEHPELYWGLRGGGGNFGVVTEFEFRLHEVDPRALLVELTFPLDAGLAVLGGWRDLSAMAPRQATFTASVSGAEVSVGYVWVGEPDQGKGLVPELRGLGRPVRERVSELTYPELQTIDDEADRHGLRQYSKCHYLATFPDAAIEAFLTRGAKDGSGEGLPGGWLEAYGGAIADVPDEETAFGHRQTLLEFGVRSPWTDPAEDADRIAVTKQVAAALEPFASGVYVNMLSDDGTDGVRRAYPPAKLARLAEVKKAYDPDNVFHLNQNIKPAP
ncbi:FAD-binding oxidoreductase [Micromonospora sp. NPDC051196]|uniref:FAD-binding oxidoreductase n=1 Tax=Micromonospora sp. NPDC051196 TaxID=3155281 RepID=UPI003449AC6D